MYGNTNWIFSIQLFTDEQSPPLPDADEVCLNNMFCFQVSSRAIQSTAKQVAWIFRYLSNCHQCTFVFAGLSWPLSYSFKVHCLSPRNFQICHQLFHMHPKDSALVQSFLSCTHIWLLVQQHLHTFIGSQSQKFIFLKLYYTLAGLHSIRSFNFKSTCHCEKSYRSFLKGTTIYNNGYYIPNLKNT